MTLSVPTLCKIWIKHNDESDHTVSKASRMESLNLTHSNNFFCTDKSERIFVFIIRLMYFLKPVSEI